MLMKRSKSQLYGDEKEWESVACWWKGVRVGCMGRKRSESVTCWWKGVRVSCMVMKRSEHHLHGDEKEWHSALCEQAVNHISMGLFSAFWAASFVEKMNGSNGCKCLTTVRYYQRVTVTGFVILESVSLVWVLTGGLWFQHNFNFGGVYCGSRSVIPFKMVNRVSSLCNFLFHTLPESKTSTLFCSFC